MTDIRASEIEEGMHIREYGQFVDDSYTVAEVDMHGDTVLITDAEGWRLSFDRDEVVELLGTTHEMGFDYVDPEKETTAELIVLDNGEPVSSCCLAPIERRVAYTDTHVFVVDAAEVGEDGAIVSAKYSLAKIYDGTDGVLLAIACSQCEQEIEQDDIDWQQRS